jgi:phage gpG-like protein
MIKAVIIGGEQVKKRFDQVYSQAQVELFQAMNRVVIELARKIKEDKLSGQVLKTGPTGTLRRSITSSVNMGANTIQGQVGTNVEYAAIHEYGGTVHIPELVPKHAKALHFLVKGSDVFAKRVKAHDVKIPTT